jgi:DNA-binding LytR/AlgR family response regulator
MRPLPPRHDHFLRHRRAWEIGLWVAFLTMQCVFNSIVVMMEHARSGGGYDLWRPLVWESSSALVLLALLPALLVFDRRFPLGAGQWRRNLPWHLAASVAYSMVHVVAMVALRQGAYALAGDRYDFGDWRIQWVYEYLKDVRTYFLSLAIVYGYRFIVLRLQGEASLLATPDEGPPVEPVERPDRFLVRKLGKEFLVAAEDIEWLEADGNYVNLHVKGRLYPLRSTMTAIEPRLDPTRFLRVHRSHIVNLDHLAEIEPLDTGDARLKLKDGTAIPCSRRYRAGLRARGGVELTAS